MKVVEFSVKRAADTPTRSLADRKPAALARLLAPDSLTTQAYLTARPEEAAKFELRKVKISLRQEWAIKRRWRHGSAQDRQELLGALTNHAHLHEPASSFDMFASLFLTATKTEARLLANHVLDIAAATGNRNIAMNTLGYALDNANHEVRQVIERALDEHGFTKYERRLGRAIKLIPPFVLPLALNIAAILMNQRQGSEWVPNFLAAWVSGVAISTAAAGFALSKLCRYEYKFLTNEHATNPTTPTSEPAPATEASQ